MLYKGQHIFKRRLKDCHTQFRKQVCRVRSWNEVFGIKGRRSSSAVSISYVSNSHYGGSFLSNFGAITTKIAVRDWGTF